MAAELRFERRLLHPRYWLTWVGFGVWWLSAQLPYSWQMLLGSGLGRLLTMAAPRRAAIAARNLELCFPEWNSQQRQQALDGVMDSIGKAFFETGIAWFLPHKRLRRLCSLEGLEYLQQAQAAGQGVILLSMHFTHLDLGAAIISFNHSIDGTYRAHDNPVYDYVQRRGRERHNTTGVAITRGDVRAMIRALKNGRAIWYAPDQDYGARHSVFAPFFGVSAATVTATAELARLGKAIVIPYIQSRKADGSGYHLKVLPPVEHYPEGDAEVDAARINHIIEACIRLQPEQYLWVHRRFKTRPEGEPDLYSSAGIAKGTRT